MAVKREIWFAYIFAAGLVLSFATVSVVFFAKWMSHFAVFCWWCGCCGGGLSIPVDRLTAQPLLSPVAGFRYGG